ncbi:MAG: hypothetical protein M3N22_03160 [Acidobacteriota bacterium]|nr:hypothetical protein [Acidobacteriota bacterium]
MNIFPREWGQAARPAPTQPSAVAEAAVVSEIKNMSYEEGFVVEDSPQQSGAATSTQTGGVQPSERAPAQPRTRGFLHIVRHGTGPYAIYVVTYHRLDSFGSAVMKLKPAMAEGAQMLIDLLERLGVDFNLRDARGALEDILRLGSANIPDLWLSDEEMLEKGLVES